MKFKKTKAMYKYIFLSVILPRVQTKYVILEIKLYIVWYVL